MLILKWFVTFDPSRKFCFRYFAFDQVVVLLNCKVATIPVRAPVPVKCTWRILSGRHVLASYIFLMKCSW
jgi:hypothetical protein